MTIEELHIDFLSKFQRQGSYDFGAFEKDEIDWLLNEAQLTRIHQILEGRNSETNFDRVVNKYDVLENLIVRDSPIIAYIKNTTTVEARLPGNYLEYVGSRNVVGCDKALKGSYLSNVKFMIEDKPYTKFTVYLTARGYNPICVYNLTDALLIRDVIVDADSMFYMKRHVLDAINNLNPAIRASLSSDNFIHVEADSNAFALRSATAEFHDGIIPGQRFSHAYGKNNTFSYMTAGTTIVPNHLINHQGRNAIFANPYARPNSNNHVVEIAGGTMFISHPAKSNVTSVNLDYIRAPRSISHRTRVSVELGSTYGAKYHYGSQIVDIAVKLAAMRIGSPVEGVLHVDSLTT